MTMSEEEARGLLDAVQGLPSLPAATRARFLYFLGEAHEALDGARGVLERDADGVLGEDDREAVAQAESWIKNAPSYEALLEAHTHAFVLHKLGNPEGSIALKDRLEGFDVPEEFLRAAGAIGYVPPDQRS